MSVDFPSSPVVGQYFSAGTHAWTWNGTGWEHFPAANSASINVLSGVQVLQPLIALVARNSYIEVAASLFRQLLLSYGPLLYWRLDETSGTSANNQISTQDIGTYGGTIAYSQSSLLTSDANSSAGFTNGYVSVSPSDFTIGLPNKTYGGIYYMSDFSSTRLFMHLGDTTQGSGQGFWVDAYSSGGGNGGLEVQWYNASFLYMVVAPGIFLPNTRYFVVLRANSTTNIDIFVNGTKYNVVLPSVPAINPSANRLTFGAIKQATYTPTFTGRMDELFMIPRSLTDQEIADLTAAV